MSTTLERRKRLQENLNYCDHCGRRLLGGWYDLRHEFLDKPQSRGYAYSYGAIPLPADLWKCPYCGWIVWWERVKEGNIQLED